MRSMTGFGEASVTGERANATVTLRSVNQRGLDIAMRLREDLRSLEPSLRRRLGARLARGRVDVGVEVAALDPSLRGAVVDQNAVATYLAAASELRERYGIAGDLTLGELLRLPEVLRPQASGTAIATAAEKVVESALELALDRLITDREREGKALRAVLLTQLGELEAAARALRARAPAAIEAARTALAARVEEAVGAVDLDPDRLAQEVALLADRADIREELDRLDAHLEALAGALDSGEPAGKRLEALLQEVLRELSTTGAKSRDSELKAVVIEARLLTESMREQVANVE